MSTDLSGTKAIVHYFQKVSSTTPNASAITQLIQQQKQLSHRLDLGKAFYMIIDYTQFNYQFVSDSFTDVLGYPVSLPMEKHLDFIRDIMHPEDAPHLVRLWEVITDHCQHIPAADMPRSTYTVDFRLRHADGHYSHFLQQTMMLKTDERGQFQYELIKVTDISHWQKKSPITGILSTPSPQHNLICIPAENICLRGRLFSDAEYRVLEELVLGNRSKAIAKNLNRSIHTVDTHRRNMLRKTHSSNTPELIRFAYLTGAL